MGERPVIFLDFDGVICSPRAFTAQAELWSGEQRPLRWADPIACDMVRLLAAKHNAWIVVSSTWRLGSRAHCDKVLGRYGLHKFQHPDWRTGEDLGHHRGTEIASWLAANGNPPFIILDDDSDFTEAQLPWHVRSCSHNGLMLADYDKADKLLASLSTPSRGEG